MEWPTGPLAVGIRSHPPTAGTREGPLEPFGGPPLEGAHGHPSEPSREGTTGPLHRLPVGRPGGGLQGGPREGPGGGLQGGPGGGLQGGP